MKLPAVNIYRTYDKFCQEYRISCTLFNVQLAQWPTDDELFINFNGKTSRFPYETWAVNSCENIVSVTIYTKYMLDADEICSGIREFVRLLAE